MLSINAEGLDHRELNEALRSAERSCRIESCCGQRFIAAGMADKDIILQGVPGNALGAYLNGSRITVQGNAQDAVGDTMNAGTIVIHGNVGDAAGYAMRGGRIFVKGNTGYRAGSFLGEYQAGGVIIVLDLDTRQGKCVGKYPCTGMHGGKMFLRSNCEDIDFPEQVTARQASPDDMNELRGHLMDYCKLFGLDLDEVMDAHFTVVTPDSRNPYEEMYVAN